MTFDDILAQVLDLLQHEQRVSYRALKRRFDLDDDDLEDVKDELIYPRFGHFCEPLKSMDCTELSTGFLKSRDLIISKG